MEWISIEDRLPEEHPTIFDKFFGTGVWDKAMFRRRSKDVPVTVVNESGDKFVIIAHTCDGQWRDIPKYSCCKVTHWVPLPEPPKED